MSSGCLEAQWCCGGYGTSGMVREDAMVQLCVQKGRQVERPTTWTLENGK